MTDSQKEAARERAEWKAEAYDKLRAALDKALNLDTSKDDRPEAQRDYLRAIDCIKQLRPFRQPYTDLCVMLDAALGTTTEGMSHELARYSISDALSRLQAKALNTAEPAQVAAARSQAYDQGVADTVALVRSLRRPE